MKSDWSTDERSELAMSWELDRAAVTRLMPDRVKELDECIETCRYLLEDNAPVEVRNEWKSARHRGNMIIAEMIVRSQPPAFVTLETFLAGT